MTRRLRSQAALDEIARAIGYAHVRRGEETADYADPYGFERADDRLIAGAVLPGSVEDIQAILAIALDHQTPLWTVSRGRNYGYGGAAPRVAASVIVDLQRMNRVLEVDPVTATALVEPGVSFEALAHHLRKNDVPLWPSVPDIAWGSVIGNTLERGFGYTAYGQHEAQCCGLEVVLADGQVVRTGMGAVKDGRLWTQYRGGYGPSVDGLFFQSNLGIVTKMGIWLMPRPEWAAACMWTVQDDSDLAPMIDALRPLLLDGTIQSNAVIGNATIVASMISDRPAWAQGNGPMSEPEIMRMAAGLGLGRWNARFGIYGDEPMVTARLARVRRSLGGLKGSELTVRWYAGDENPEAVSPADRAQLGVPCTDLVRMGAWRGGEPAHTDFSLVCSPKGAEAARQTGAIRTTVESFGFDYAGGFTLFPRHAIALALVAFDKDDERQTKDVGVLMRRLIETARAAGDAPYRSHTAFMDDIAESYGHGGLENLKSMLKGALDPQGILSPGKQGIWPEA